MKSISIDEITKHLDANYKIIGNNNKIVTSINNITSANSKDLVWVNPTRKDKQELVNNTKSQVIVCDGSISITEKHKEQKCFIIVENPKLAIIKIINAFFAELPKYGIHHSSIINKDAIIHDKVYIGPNSTIGKCEINEGTIIYGNTYIYDNVKIGKNVIIHAGCVIGSDGFGFTRDKSGKVLKFPHIGGVIIEDDVELQAMNHVSKGTLGDTIIGRGSKFDSCCHVAHNDIIGQDNIIAAHTMFSGSVKVGNKCWIGPASVFRDVIEVGNESFIGIGSLIPKTLPANSFVMGAPAKPIKEYKQLLRILKNLIVEEECNDK